jgi:hypothetical protein
MTAPKAAHRASGERGTSALGQPSIALRPASVIMTRSTLFVCSPILTEYRRSRKTHPWRHRGMASPLPATVQRSLVRPWSRPLAVAFGFGRPRVGNRLIDGPLDLGVGEVLAGLGTLDDFGTGGIWGLKGAPRRTVRHQRAVG